MVDTSRLLTNLETIEISAKYRHGDCFDLTGYTEEIVANTASIKDAEYQKKIKEIFKEIEKVIRESQTNTDRVRIDTIQRWIQEYADCQQELDSHKTAVEIDNLYEEERKLAESLRDQFFVNANINVIDK